MDNLTLEGKARLDILKGALSAGKTGAHIAPSLSDVDLCIAVLRQYIVNKDCFILSKGHGALGYYAAMHQIGLISDEQFASFEADGGEFPGQPSRHYSNQIQYSSGSLGMGLSYGLGTALGKRTGIVYVVLGDGELNEGSNWEAAMLAAKYHLENLTAVVDYNGFQSDGKCEDITDQNLNALWKAYGWHVVECDGHDINEITKALNISHPGKPLVVIAHTVKGKGVSFMENDNAWHHAVLNKSDYEKAVNEIGEKYGLF